MRITEQTRNDARKLSKKFEKQARPSIETKIKYGTQSKRIEAAQRYAEADKSDPFAYGRAMAHMKNGVAGFLGDGRDAFYDADEYEETRTIEKIINGETVPENFQVKAFKNRVRP